jgi:hypothetical protein
MTAALPAEALGRQVEIWFTDVRPVLASRAR